MAIPPFPNQEAAKLVLGYLAEEQLMTAYDEFLNASPYLDAHKNEYDRVMMNSLRNILAEYKACRINVESCKPIILRRRLFQCSNLLEVFQVLVQYVDIKKLQDDINRELLSIDSQDANTSRIGCDVCHSSRLENCVCSCKRRTVSSSKSNNNSELVLAGRSIAQATPLSDLPGNQNPDNKPSRVPEFEANQSNTVNQQEDSTHTYPVANIANVGQNSIIPSLQIQSNSNITTTHKQNVCGNANALECSQNIAEFNSVLSQVYNNSKITGNLRDNKGLICSENDNNNRLSVAGSFQDFSTGVRGAPCSNVNIPDSSTTENTNVPNSDNDQIIQNRRNIKTQQTKKCVFRVGNVKHDVTEITSEVIDVDSVDIPKNAPYIPKPEEQKVTILSNVRIGNDEGPIMMSKNATSTPLLHMQTIYINGTPVYKPKPVEQKYTFTRDEIMAMPTIILVPTSGPSKVAPPVGVQPQTVSAQSSNITTSTCHVPQSTLPPLTVDVSNNSTNVVCNIPIAHKTQEVSVQDKPGLVKTVEALKNASVPKDNIVSGSSSTSTPQMLPPKRKSSSTPRRTSHVRVLDFTTPRRILNETIIENPNQDTELENPVESMITKSPNVSVPRDSIVADNTGQLHTTIETDPINNTVIKAPVANKITKKSWDDDLRALVASSESAGNALPPMKPKPKRRLKKDEDEKDTDKKKTTANNTEKTRKKSSVKNNVSINVKHSKKKDKAENVEKPEEKVPSPTVSPIGITCACREKVPAAEPEKEQNKSNEEERIDTPEVERLSLRNEIGVKLNISDILETPYKQALYEIQMETPRFLGPEFPDGPMSDIKITDIPTPRFLSSNMPITPKPTQATPSSYSSRPTDYSSGGSYYKPDDQDYLPILDDMTCPVTSTHSKDSSKVNTVKSATEPVQSQPKEKSKRNRSRPVRQCTKNVSYYNSPMTNKNTDTNKRDDVSSCSDSVSVNSVYSLDLAVKDKTAIPKSDRIKQSTKPGTKKNLSLAKKRSPLKKIAQKPFMKIKPRRPTGTPTKDSGCKGRKSSESSQKTSKVKPRIRNTSKNKVSGSPSLVVPAQTKSRRKSSTPRKLHCTKTFNSESSGHESPEAEKKEKTHYKIQNSSVSCVPDSDTENLPLRWSDDGSQDMKLQGDTESIVENDNDGDDISKIKEYIDKTESLAPSHKNGEGSLRNDLIKRGFDMETAKIIERDLLNTPIPTDDSPKLQTAEEPKSNKILERSVESDSNNLVIVDESDSDESDFTVQECNEESANYLFMQHDGSIPPVKDDSKLKDKFTMEVGIEEGVVVRLKTTSFKYLFDHDPQVSGNNIEIYRETEMAVNSISNMERLYTPMKDPIRAQCYEIFDSTLTSIDTPLKGDSPTRKQNATVSEIVLDEEDGEEKLEMKEKAVKRKRKRSHCSSASDDSVNENKKVKPETQFMLQTQDIKNIDIEVLLSKLHGS